jgi:hypothetical protein
MATRSQLQTIHALGSNRNASRVLKNLERYVNVFRDIENIYYLNKEGRDLVGCQKVITKNLQYQHTLMRNDIYIHFKQPKNWANEYEIKAEKSIICDAVFEAGGFQYFLEVDRMQKMNTNIEKLNNYFSFKLTNLWQRNNGGSFPIVLFYTATDSRKEQLLKNNPGLNLQIYTKTDIL